MKEQKTPGQSTVFCSGTLRSPPGFPKRREMFYRNGDTGGNRPTGVFPPNKGGIKEHHVFFCRRSGRNRKGIPRNPCGALYPGGHGVSGKEEVVYGCPAQETRIKKEGYSINEISPFDKINSDYFLRSSGVAALTLICVLTDFMPFPAVSRVTGPDSPLLERIMTCASPLKAFT